MTSETHSSAGHRPYRFRIDLPADVRSITVARRFVRDSLSRLGTSSADAEIAVSEMYTAAIAGAAPGDRVDVEVRRRGDEIDIEVCSTNGPPRDLDPVQHSVMLAIADYYERRDIGDFEVQSYGCLVVEGNDCAQRPDNASTTGAKTSGSRTT